MWVGFTCCKALFILLFTVLCVFSVMPNSRIYCSAKQILHGLPYIIPHTHFTYFDCIFWAGISSVVLFIINILILHKNVLFALLSHFHSQICYQKWYWVLHCSAVKEQRTLCSLSGFTPEGHTWEEPEPLLHLPEPHSQLQVKQSQEGLDHTL